MAIRSSDPVPLTGGAWAAAWAEVLLPVVAVVAIGLSMSRVDSLAALAAAAFLATAAVLVAMASILYAATRSQVPLWLRLVRIGCAAGAAVAFIAL